MCRASVMFILIFLSTEFHETCFGTVQLTRVVKRQVMSNQLCDGHEKWTIQTVQSSLKCALLCNRDDRRMGTFYNTATHTCHCRGSGQFVTGCTFVDNTEFYSFVNCANGYTLYEEGNFCFKIHSDCNHSWQESLDNCGAEDAGLINLWDDTTSEYFRSLAQTTYADCGTFTGLWIGFEKVNNTWKWLDGIPVDMTKYWGPVEPSGDGPCGTLLDYGDGFVYNDMTCSPEGWSFVYICSRQ